MINDVAASRVPAAAGRRMLALVLVSLTTVPACAKVGGPGVGTCASYLVGGAALGAGLGAITGNDAKDRRRRAAVGAAAGMAGGYAVCVRVWRQKAALEAQFTAVDQESGGAVPDPANRVVRSVEVVDNREIRLELNLMFSTAQSDVPPRAEAHLAALAASLQQFPDSRVLVAGHTDNVGDPARNQLLSQRRAEAVAAYLAARGVAPTRIEARGLGSGAPVADNATEEGRARNRRVEVTIQPTVPAAK